jgi:pyruvate/2-oxoglutarate dehydrogenase complex dihydrolipoamide acyltransferase (E2) component
MVDRRRRPRERGDILCIIESERATQELEGFDDGILRHLKKEGEVIASPNDMPCRIDPA